jgi:hypothetical protein
MQEFKRNDIVKNFRREFLNENDHDFIFKILYVADNTETKEKQVVYQAMFSNKMLGYDYNVLITPLSKFTQEVNKNVYPNIKQKYVFEKL